MLPVHNHIARSYNWLWVATNCTRNKDTDKDQEAEQMDRRKDRKGSGFSVFILSFSIFYGSGAAVLDSSMVLADSSAWWQIWN